MLAEGKDPASILVTGNTVIDAMQHTVVDDYSHPELDWVGDSRFIFITAHRRENLGEPMHNMFRAIRRVLDEHPDVKAIYPIHMNPVVWKAADEELGDCDWIHIIDRLRCLTAIILRRDAICALRTVAEFRRSVLLMASRFWLCVIRRSIRRAWKRGR